MRLSIRVLTVFPDLVESAVSEGMVRIAREQGVLDVRAVNLRDFTDDVHRTTDDAPYGGGAGMVMKVDPVIRAWRGMSPEERGQAFVLSPRGKTFDRDMAWEWSQMTALTLVCGRYQGLDQRAVTLMDAQEISIGDFVLAGGELPAAVMIEAVARLLPGVLGDEGSREQDSFEDRLLGFPVYTRPEVYEGLPVPEVLLSGHHARIEAWRRQSRLEATARTRPELLEESALTAEDKVFLKTLLEQKKEAGFGREEKS